MLLTVTIAKATTPKTLLTRQTHLYFINWKTVLGDLKSMPLICSTQGLSNKIPLTVFWSVILRPIFYQELLCLKWPINCKIFFGRRAVWILSASCRTERSRSAKTKTLNWTTRYFYQVLASRCILLQEDLKKSPNHSPVHSPNNLVMKTRYQT